MDTSSTITDFTITDFTVTDASATMDTGSAITDITTTDASTTMDTGSTITDFTVTDASATMDTGSTITDITTTDASTILDTGSTITDFTITDASATLDTGLTITDFTVTDASTIMDTGSTITDFTITDFTVTDASAIMDTDSTITDFTVTDASTTMDTGSTITEFTTTIVSVTVGTTSTISSTDATRTDTVSATGIATTSTDNTTSVSVSIATTLTTTTGSVTSNFSITTLTFTTTNVLRCNESSEVDLGNGSCMSKEAVRMFAVSTLRNKPSDANVTVTVLSLYFHAIVNSNLPSTSENTLSPVEIDRYVNTSSNATLVMSRDTSFIMFQQLGELSTVTIVGSAFIRGSGGQVLNISDSGDVIESNFSAAATISSQFLAGVTSLNMLIIDKPTTYEKIDNSTNKSLASSVIVVAVKRNRNVSTPLNISLFFQVLKEYQPNVSANYFCSFYDTTQSTWNEFGCMKPRYNLAFDRYECSCNHTTTFALVWLPKLPLTRNLNAQDIASLIFQSISICCFLAIIIHAIFIRIRDPIMSLRTNDALPLISYAVTMILFVFYIALAMTVYTKETYDDEEQCFLSSSVLMFFVYFFLIFMFCVKTSVGYFNYLRFVRLFPEPSYRRLFILLVISFFISITWVAFAAGFNSNASFQITKLYPYKLCWFTRDVIYYFLTIPVGIFLLINIFIFIRVAQRILHHVRNATSPHHSYERMKQCVVILFLSCATQGIGWLLGPFLTFASEDTANVLGWFFIIFNGLEGLWVILIYLVVRSQRMDEQKRVTTVREFRKSQQSKSTSRRYKQSSREDNEQEDRSIGRETEVKHRNTDNEASRSFDDPRDIIMMGSRVDGNTLTSYC
ncbi:unnamed protein product [Rotaria sp. Silwood2]|nr:unnamed protein product [Rotaria sp. Silwood2]